MVRISLTTVVVGFPLITGLVLLRSRVTEQRESEAKEWCKGLVSALDSYHAVHGDFPERMENVADLSDAPVLVRDGSPHYSKISGGFRLDLWNGFVSGWRWDTRTRYWLSYPQ